MIRRTQVITSLIFMSLIVQAQNTLNDKDELINKSIDIEEIIKLKESDKQQQNLLIKFKNIHGNEDRISVEEFKDYYELIINHPGENGYSGGAECYTLDKRSGETTMKWHEHPMKLPEIEEMQEE